jgi:ferrous iron transport protein A
MMLNQMPVGSYGTVIHISGGKAMLRKLMSLGIKTGSDVEILHHRGKGVVVLSMGTRIAVGESISRHIEVRPQQLSQSAVLRVPQAC